jgi:tRNA threonylcarbamoyl adenosine modification protein YeaZ
MNANVILCIESAIGSGSLAVFRDGRELAPLTDSSDASRAEELLQNIDILLREHNLCLTDLKTIVISTGPGSFTGIRIGIATALGLRAALNVQCLGITALQAIAASANGRQITAVVPMGSEMVAMQSFEESRAVSEPELRSILDFEKFLETQKPASVLAHDTIAVRFADSFSQVINIGRNLASLFHTAIHSDFADRELRPLFIDRRQFTKI